MEHLERKNHLKQEAVDLSVDLVWVFIISKNKLKIGTIIRIIMIRIIISLACNFNYKISKKIQIKQNNKTLKKKKKKP